MSAATPAPSAPLCPSCGCDITLRDPQGSKYFGCPACATFFEWQAGGKGRVIRKFNARFSPPVPVGAVGKFSGEEWTVVGYMRKSEGPDEPEWDEYVLWQPGKPYHILVQHAGDWLMVTPAPRDYFVTKVSEFDFYVRDGRAMYTTYHTYRFQIPYAVGEFDWNILDDAGAMLCSEFIGDDKVLVQEHKGRQTDWYEGRELHVHRVLDAFAGQVTRDQRQQMINRAASVSPPLKHFTLLMLGLVLLFQCALAILQPAKQVLRQEFVVGGSQLPAEPSKSETLVTGAFRIPGSGAVNIHLYANVVNDWMDVPVTLVNEQTGRAYEATKSLEYYTGYDSDGSWTEGSQGDEVTFSRVPAGQYHLNIYPATGNESTTFSPMAGTDNTHLLEVRISAGGRYTSNLVLMVLAILAWPVCRYFYANRHR